jgi:hypothetical protein
MQMHRSMLVGPRSAHTIDATQASRVCWIGAVLVALGTACAADTSLSGVAVLQRSSTSRGQPPADSAAAVAAPAGAGAATPRAALMPVASVTPVKPDWQLLLEDGIDSYENGAYGNAIRKLGDVANNPQADDATRLKALKYLAFSYCVSPDPPGSNATHLALCRQTFERALAVDADFDLAPGERGHPIWSKELAVARGRLANKPRSSSTRSASTSAGTGPVSKP